MNGPAGANGSPAISGPSPIEARRKAARSSGSRNKVSVCLYDSVLPVRALRSWSHEGVVLLGQPDVAGGFHVGHADIAEYQRCFFGLRGVGDDVNGAARDVDEIAGLQDDLLAVAAIALRLDAPDPARHDVPADVVVRVVMRRVRPG